MEKYFDAHIYVANWGTRCLMLRLPRGSVDENTLALYVSDGVMDYWTTDEYLIVHWQRDEGSDDDWVNGEGRMARLVPLRDELEQGDYRAFYLGWLYGVSTGNIPEDESEPSVPVGLRSPTAAQHALAEFLGIDEDLLAAAVLTSPPTPAVADSQDQFSQYLANVSADEAKQYLLLLLQGRAREAAKQIRRKYTMSQRSQTVPVDERRAVVSLLPSAARYPQIPWSKVIGTRHRLIHGYDLVDFDLLQGTITNDLPPLVEALERILAEDEAD